jgi:hypothetical protein
MRGRSINSASRIASNKMHHDKTHFNSFSDYILTRNWWFDKSVSGDNFCIPDNSRRQPNTLADAQIKN